MLDRWGRLVWLVERCEWPGCSMFIHAVSAKRFVGEKRGSNVCGANNNNNNNIERAHYRLLPLFNRIQFIYRRLLMPTQHNTGHIYSYFFFVCVCSIAKRSPTTSSFKCILKRTHTNTHKIASCTMINV